LATYARGVETIALVNSEELSNFITARHALPCVFHVPYDINPVLRSRLQACVKQKKIIVYGRPSVARNLFGLIVEGLRVWQGTNPEAHCIFELVFAGEPFDEAQISELENARTVGKLSLEEYAQLLNESAIGIALMMSPHPSYPPLEMAAAGCQVITNAYEFKDLTRRAPNILSLEAVTPQALAAALDVAVASVRWGFAAPLVEISHIPTAVPEIDYRRVAGLLRPVQ
jgi:hypothetical protein